MEDTDWLETAVKFTVIGCIVLFVTRMIFSIGSIDMPVFNYISTAVLVPVGIGGIVLLAIYLGKKARN